jgi:hypothetical protein
MYLWDYFAFVSPEQAVLYSLVPSYHTGRFSKPQDNNASLSRNKHYFSFSVGACLLNDPFQFNDENLNNFEQN